MIKIGTALFEACEELERERGISKEVLIASETEVTSSEKKPRYINGTDTMNDKGADNNPNKNALTNCPTGSGDKLSLLLI